MTDHIRDFHAQRLVSAIDELAYYRKHPERFVAFALAAVVIAYGLVAWARHGFFEFDDDVHLGAFDSADLRALAILMILWLVAAVVLYPVGLAGRYLRLQLLVARLRSLELSPQEAHAARKRNARGRAEHRERLDKFVSDPLNRAARR